MDKNISKDQVLKIIAAQKQNLKQSSGLKAYHAEIDLDVMTEMLNEMLVEIEEEIKEL